MPSDTMKTCSHRPDAQHGTSRTDLSSPAPLAPWVYDEVLGIVHHEGCRTCRHYMMHVSDSALEDSYSLALRQRDAELRRRFMEGFRRGRTTQQEHDSERLQAYRAQRDEARTLETVHKLKLEEANALVAQLRDELLALQIAYDQLRSPTPHDWDPLDSSDGPESPDANSPLTSDGEAASDPNAPDFWDGDGADDSGVDFDDDDGESTSAPSDEEEIVPGAEAEAIVDPHISDPWDEDDDADYSEEDSYDDDDSESASTPPDEEEFEFEAEVGVAEEIGNEAADDMERIAAMKVSGSTLQLNVLSLVSSADSSDSSDTNFHDYHVTLPHQPLHIGSPQPSTSSLLSTPPSAPVPVPGNYSLADIREQMKLAHHPDKREILVHVRSLVSEAHRTDSALRTEVQKVLLAEWRKPSPLSPQSGETIYVDASGLGIGFVFGDRWQAWRWKKSWKQESRDIQWAEAVAVELGIRLMIAAGYSDRKIVLYSDNRQVVDAVSGHRAIGEFYTSQIVHKIDRLCEKYLIQLEILWIPGEQNPADAPSRLNPAGREKTRFPHQINIPKHLQEFVLPWV